MSRFISMSTIFMLSIFTSVLITANQPLEKYDKQKQHPQEQAQLADEVEDKSVPIGKYNKRGWTFNSIGYNRGFRGRSQKSKLYDMMLKNRGNSNYGSLYKNYYNKRSDNNAPLDFEYYVY